MVTPTAGAVVLVPFPFSDLSRSKLRLTVVLALAGRDDWILWGNAAEGARRVAAEVLPLQFSATEEEGNLPS